MPVIRDAYRCYANITGSCKRITSYSSVGRGTEAAHNRQ
jgi:hypothetical protein